jgi:hypothetical protein
MDPQRLRASVRCFNEAGPAGLIDRKPAGAGRRLGLRHISARPRHPGQDLARIVGFKKRMARPVRK